MAVLSGRREMDGNLSNSILMDTLARGPSVTRTVRRGGRRMLRGVGRRTRRGKRAKGMFPLEGCIGILNIKWPGFLILCWRELNKAIEWRNCWLIAGSESLCRIARLNLNFISQLLTWQWRQTMKHKWPGTYLDKDKIRTVLFNGSFHQPVLTEGRWNPTECRFVDSSWRLL